MDTSKEFNAKKSKRKYLLRLDQLLENKKRLPVLMRHIELEEDTFEEETNVLLGKIPLPPEMQSVITEYEKVVLDICTLKECRMGKSSVIKDFKIWRSLLDKALKTWLSTVADNNPELLDLVVDRDWFFIVGNDWKLIFVERMKPVGVCT